MPRMLPFALFVLMFFSSHSKASPIKLLILGDSLTAGYGVDKKNAFPALLENKLSQSLAAPIEVIAAGISGSTSASGLKRLKWQLKKKPTHLFLALGANDGLRGFPISETQKNLTAIVDLAQSNQVQVFLAGMHMPPNYGEDYQKSFSKIYTQLAESKNLSFYPFLLAGVAGQAQYNLGDQIHPNEKGHAVIADKLHSFLLAHLKGKVNAPHESSKTSMPKKDKKSTN